MVVTDAQLNILVGVYAVGVFTGFTFAGFGMAKHHLRLREKGWRHKLAINGFAGLLALSVVLIFVIVKFKEGVWIVVVLFIILVPTRSGSTSSTSLRERARGERRERRGRPDPSPSCRPVFVDRLDLATARALQYVRTPNPDELRAVHFVLDSAALSSSRTSGAARTVPFPLDLVECPDRRLTRGAMELIAEVVADGQHRGSAVSSPALLRGRLDSVCCTITRPTTSPRSWTSCRT